MKCKYLLIFCLVLLVSGTSCRKLVQDEFPDFENRITVNSILECGEVAQVHLSFTDGLNEHELKDIDNATVVMFNNDTLIEFNYAGEGLYVSDYTVAENDSFKLKVSIDTAEVTSECYVPEIPQILDWSVVKNGWVDSDGMLQPKVYFTIKNNDQQQYYEALLIATINDYGNEEDVVELISLALFDNINEMSDSITKSIEVKHETSFYPPKPWRYQMIIRGIDENYYRYLISFNNYNLTRFPDFSNGSVVPVNLFSNIRNGYGIFCGSSVVVTSETDPM